MLRVYVKRGCPFCKRVLDYAKKHNIQLHEKDIYNEEQNLQELLETGDKWQVPFLFDESASVSMYESDDIIEYLKQRYAK